MYVSRKDKICNGWVTYDFTSFSTVVQSYQDDGRMIMKKNVCNGTPFTIELLLLYCCFTSTVNI